MSKKIKSAESYIKEVKRRIRLKFSTEEKIRIVIEGLRGEESIASLCRRKVISQPLYYKWNKDLLEAGKRGTGSDNIILPLIEGDNISTWVHSDGGWGRHIAYYSLNIHRIGN